MTREDYVKELNKVEADAKEEAEYIAEVYGDNTDDAELAIAESNKWHREVIDSIFDEAEENGFNIYWNGQKKEWY